MNRYVRDAVSAASLWAASLKNQLSFLSCSLAWPLRPYRVRALELQTRVPTKEEDLGEPWRAMLEVAQLSSTFFEQSGLSLRPRATEF